MRLRRLYPTADDLTVSDKEAGDTKLAAGAQGTGTAAGGATGAALGALGGGLLSLLAGPGAPALAAVTVPAGLSLGSALGSAAGAGVGGAVADSAGKEAANLGLQRSKRGNSFDLRQKALQAFLARGGQS